MAFTEFPTFNIEDIVGLNTNGPHDAYNLSLNIACPSQPDTTTDAWGGWTDFGVPCWDLSALGGPSQSYAGVEVWGDLNNYPDLPLPLGAPEPLSPNSAPTSLYPANGVVPGEGYLSPYHWHTPLPPVVESAVTPPQPTAPSLTPTLSCGDQLLPQESYTTLTPPTYHSYAQPQAVLDHGGLGHSFSAAAGIPSLSAVHPPPHYIPSYEEQLHQLLQAGPHNRDFDTVAMGGSTSQLVAPAHPIPQRVAPPEPPLPQPVASSSGVERTGKSGRGARRHDPIKPAKKAKNVEPRKDEEGWLETLKRFRDEFKALCSVQDGQPPGGFVPETAFAKFHKFIKEDLKRSPFRKTGAGNAKRIRDFEGYLKRVVNVMLPKPAPGDRRSSEAVGILSRLARELEGKLRPINEGPSLPSDGMQEEEEQQEQQDGVEKTDKEREQEVEAKQKKRKNNQEKERREMEQYHLGRVGSLFKLPPGRKRPWTKQEALILGLVFLLYGPAAFSDGVVEVLPTTQDL